MSRRHLLGCRVRVLAAGCGALPKAGGRSGIPYTDGIALQRLKNRHSVGHGSKIRKFHNTLDGVCVNFVFASTNRHDTTTWPISLRMNLDDMIVWSVMSILNNNWVKCYSFAALRSACFCVSWLCMQFRWNFEVSWHQLSSTVDCQLEFNPISHKWWIFNFNANDLNCFSDNPVSFSQKKWPQFYL